MDLLVEFGKILLPAVAVMYAMYLTVKMFIQKEWQTQKMSLAQKSTETILPIRLQAYERMCLFLERISPNNLIVRLNNGEYNAAQFQHVLLAEIREEFNHNLSQQVYMSDEAWNMVRRAMEDLVVKINQAGSEIANDAKALDLAKRIFDLMMEQGSDQIQEALVFIKEEIRQEF
ncbi:MAG: hypothetical protein AAGC88_05085 [Bacteroidota bacterium]